MSIFVASLLSNAIARIHLFSWTNHQDYAKNNADMRKKIVGLLVILLLIGGTVVVWSQSDREEDSATQAAPAAPSARISAEQAQILYEQACSILNNPAVNDVTGVPSMLEKCAEAGHAEASLLLLDVYEGKRKGIDADLRKASDWALRIATCSTELKLAVEARFRYARYEERRATRQSLKNAFNNMRLAARMGCSQARAELARYLMFGIGTSRNPQAAILVLKWLAKHDPKTPNVFFYAGYMYMKGMGIYGGPDYKTALFLYRKGLRWHDPRAINNMAMIYERGLGVAPDPARALHYYRLAAELGCREASTNMQRMVYNRKTSVGSTWQQRVARASLRVLDALPLAPALRNYLEPPLLQAAVDHS